MYGAAECEILNLSSEVQAMCTDRSTGMKMGSFYLPLLLVLLLLNGCSKHLIYADREILSPGLPNYKPGTTYVYSDGSWEAVVAVSSQLVKWRDSRSRVYSKIADFTYPSTYWESSTRRISRSFARRDDSLMSRSTSLWPLQKGNFSGYTEQVTSKKNMEAEKSYRRNWTCEVVDTERVSVLAGEFETWKISCKRYNNYQKPSNARVVATKTWNYAPKIEHYVLAERQLSGGSATRRLELLAVLPPLNGLPDAAKRRMKEVFQAALEFNKRDESSAWSVPGTTLSGQITPTGTFKLADGRFCRRYVQIVNYSDGPRTYFGLSVRDANGMWIIPRR